MFALWWAAPPGLEQYHPADLVHLRLQIDPLIKRGYSRNVDHSTDDDLTALAFRVAVHDRQRLDPSHIVLPPASSPIDGHSCTPGCRPNQESLSTVRPELLQVESHADHHVRSASAAVPSMIRTRV